MMLGSVVLLNQCIGQLSPTLSSLNQLFKFFFPNLNRLDPTYLQTKVSNNLTETHHETYFKILDVFDNMDFAQLKKICHLLPSDVNNIDDVKLFYDYYRLGISYLQLSKKRQILKTTLPHKYHNLLKNLVYCNFNQPCRGFKTARTKVPIRKIGKSNNPSSLNIFSIFKRNQEDSNYEKELQNNEYIKNLLNGTTSDKDKMKVSFAEGYIAGESKRNQNKAKHNILANVRELIIFVIILGMLFSVVGGPLKQMIFGNGNEIHSEDIDVSFDDIQGIPEAKNELREVVDFLKNPQKFMVLGGKLPKGVLLVGPPGTGKTLLARAVAGEAGVPFFHAVGSEFDEVLVGQGARRVRNLFSTAKDKAPCVVFIDEIDSVGAKRSKSEWHPYANQTVNQLLAEMDGFKKNEGIIVLGATNRKDDLDKALVRPGRFDMEIYIPPPDLKGRLEIFKYYLDKVKISKDIDITRLARGTTGYTGADIENMVNQSALRAAKDNLPYVTMRYLEEARDKILMGPEKRSRVPDIETNKITAYHEAGHTLVSYYTKEAIPLHKVTIIPRGFSLGHTASLPDKETYYQTKSQVCATLDTIMGGRAAEELIFGKDKITSGATDDLRKATAIASEMVKSWGMSEKVGLRVFEDNTKSLVAVNDISQAITEVLDQEISTILKESYERAKHILTTYSMEHHALAEALLKYETLEYEEIKAIIEGKKLINPNNK